MSCGFEPLYDSVLFTVLASGFAVAGLSVYKAYKKPMEKKQIA